MDSVHFYSSDSSKLLKSIPNTFTAQSTPCVLTQALSVSVNIINYIKPKVCDRCVRFMKTYACDLWAHLASKALCCQLWCNVLIYLMFVLACLENVWAHMRAWAYLCLCAPCSYVYVHLSYRKCRGCRWCICISSGLPLKGKMFALD